MALTNKQKIFVDEYLKCFNATQAARIAGYKGDDTALATIGYENIRKPYIKEIIDLKLQESAMEANEVLKRMADMARADLGDFTNVKSMDDLAKHPKSHLVKKLKQKTYYNNNGDHVTEIEIELHNSQVSLQDLAKRYGLFTEKIELSGSLEQTLVILPQKDNEQ